MRNLSPTRKGVISLLVRWERLMLDRDAILARLWARTEPIPECGCWVWMGAVSRNGYGKLSYGRVHRIAYALIKGPIPPGLTLDHKCRVRSCWNPDHLEAA